MINAIIEFSARNRFLVFALVAVGVLAGTYSMRTIPLDADPLHHPSAPNRDESHISAREIEL